ncbi:MAG TPA: phosphoenolpyruvate carboxylase [Steroidobacteraceae bacterium]|jgi:phosphoenolpyruvate carboxylase|nr:phosphoenolpyruvate carboxylase [Steroidobacteraceae bacterium]
MDREDLHFPPRHAPLREDLDALGQLLDEVLREQCGEEFFGLVLQDRLTATRWREGDRAAGEALALRVRGRPAPNARELLRAFASWFQLANLAEKVHRIRRRREYFQRDSDRPQPGGVDDAVAELKSAGLSLSEVLALLATLSIEPVMLAHPMESTRRTTLLRQQRLAAVLLERDNATLAPYERRALLERIRSEISTDWQTEEHPRERLTIADEREHAIFFLAEIIYRIIPAFYLEIASALSKHYAVSLDTLELPLIVRFGSWVGGDMETSADVHAKSIRETLARAQRVIIGKYRGECLALAQMLSQSANRAGITPEVMSRIEQYRTLLPGAQSITPSRHDRMPYRVLLTQIAERLQATYEGRSNGYEGPGQFRADIALIGQSLLVNRGMHAGHFQIRRLLWRIDTFGFHLATLDLRQHTRVHHAVLAQGLDDPQWCARTPAERHARLVELLERDAGPTGSFDALGKRSLAVFEAMVQSRHRYGAEAVGLYVVGGAAQPDDVLAPLVLARWAEAYDKSSGQVALDVAPLFEQISTLERCGQTMRELLEDEVYKRHLESRGRLQTVLIGYSESNEESGIVASRFAAYRAQRNLTEALAEAGKEHVLFYSRGGSIPRGGGRIDTLLRAAPAESVSGTLRFTEQGENVSQSYGLRPNAMRTLERAFSTLALATLAVKRGVPLRESAALAECAGLVAGHSAQAWRGLIFEEPRFYRYFREVTPIDVIERMQIGSALPARADAGMAAVPPAAWVYAWSQARHMLPGWYGAGTGLEFARSERGLALLRTCYQGWPFFRSLIDDIEAMLARSDFAVVAHYERLVAAELRSFSAPLRAEYERSCSEVLQIKESTRLLDSDRTLQRSIALRNAYLDPLHFMQVDLLERWRAGGRQMRDLFEALQASVSGIARGLQTTG